MMNNDNSFTEKTDTSIEEFRKALSDLADIVQVYRLKHDDYIRKTYRDPIVLKRKLKDIIISNIKSDDE